jgi:hypothetical protein
MVIVEKNTLTVETKTPNKINEDLLYDAECIYEIKMLVSTNHNVTNKVRDIMIITTLKS